MNRTSTSTEIIIRARTSNEIINTNEKRSIAIQTMKVIDAHKLPHHILKGDEMKYEARLSIARILTKQSPKLSKVDKGTMTSLNTQSK